MPFAVAQFARFVALEARAAAFAFLIMGGIAISTVVPLPVARYDALFVYGLGVSTAFWVLRLETVRETVAIAGFHVVGLAFEMIKVRLGAWEYPGDAVTMVAGVPLYSGFMYAAVGSYIARAWRLLDLGVSRYRPVGMVTVAVLAYVNFITHDALPDVRLLVAVVLVVVTWGSWVHFSVGRCRYRMPLPVAFGLIGCFLWLAENFSTLFHAWQYPHQRHGWEMVHVGKAGSWALLVVFSFVLVAVWKGSAVREELRVASTRRVPGGAAASA